MSYAEEQNGIIFYAKRNFARTVAFVMPTNIGPTYGMYIGPTLYQRYMSNMSYVGATFCQHVGPTMTQRANFRWANVVCQRWANEVANQNTPLAQLYHGIWVNAPLHALGKRLCISSRKCVAKTTSPIIFKFSVLFYHQ